MRCDNDCSLDSFRLSMNYKIVSKSGDYSPPSVRYLGFVTIVDFQNIT